MGFFTKGGGHYGGDLTVDKNATTSNWLNIGTTDVVGLLGSTIGAGDLFIGRNATTTGNLTVSGTTNLASASTTGSLYVGAYASSTLGLFTQGSGHFGGDLIVDGNATTSGRLILGTTNPTNNYGKLWVGGDIYISGNATTTGNFTVGTSTLVVLHDPAGTGNDRVGIGLIAPAYKLDILDTANPQLGLTGAIGTATTTFWADASGDLRIATFGSNVRMLNENLYVCAGGSCGATAPGDQGNIILENALIFENNFKLEYVDASTTIMYDSIGQAIFTFDEAP